MKLIEIIIVSVLATGIGFLLYLFLRDPVLIFKTFLRGINDDEFWRIKILAFPIWGPTWLIDKIFKLKIYIKEFEDASIAFDINLRNMTNTY